MKLTIENVEIFVEHVVNNQYEVYTLNYNEDDKDNINLDDWNEVENRHTDESEILNRFGEVMCVSTNMSNFEKAASIFFYKEGL